MSSEHSVQSNFATWHEEETKTPEAAENETHRFRQRWRTKRAQKMYSLKLYEALRRRSRRGPSTASAGIKVRDTADRVLAVVARGTTRWSRAILASRLRKVKAKAKAKNGTAGKGGRRRPERARKLPAAENRVRVLGRLVPGCRKTPLPNLLDEAADYIAALEMQVRAMTTLADILAGAQPSSRVGSAAG